MQFRDQLITYDQFIARVEEKRFGTKYQVLDDLRGKIDEKFIKLEKDDLIIQEAIEFAKKRGLSPRECDFLGGRRCVLGMFKHFDKMQYIRNSGNIDEQMQQRHREEVRQRKHNQSEVVRDRFANEMEEKQIKIDGAYSKSLQRRDESKKTGFGVEKYNSEAESK